ncbi:MAG: right-handed parallel beta-helix repeat-containing protein [Promethearchaeota archaeon]
MPTFMFIIYNFFGNQIINSTQDGKKNGIDNIQEGIQLSNDYQLVDPINISTWTDWELYSFITGNGTDLNPFIIENIEIIGVGVKTMQVGNRTLLDYTYGGIYINANGSFIIRNCKISQVSIGIHFSISIAPGDYQYRINNVEITNCSIGIYSRWPHVVVNISNCYISNCQWVSIKATIDLHNHLDYGGIGIWVRSKEGSAIEDCYIKDCSIGMMAELVEFIQNNELINCGIVPGIIISNYDSTNTVNGKPIGLFFHVNNMVFTQANASQYGQLIFIACANLTLSNIHITKPCSIGIQLYSVSLFQKTYLNNIICENQKLGFYIYGIDMIGENLYAKNCEAGFYFINIRNTKFAKVMTDNTDIPIYTSSYINNFTIEIEQYTIFYFVDLFGSYEDTLYVESSITSYNISKAYIPVLGIQGYRVQFNDTNIYQVSHIIPPDLVSANFTVISVPHYTRPDALETIPAYYFFWVWILLIIGVLISIESYRRIHRKRTKNSY